jgi:hypothetical protein
MINGLLDSEGTNKAGFCRYPLILSKASWYSSFHTLGFFFGKSQNIGSQVAIIWEINRVM